MQLSDILNRIRANGFEAIRGTELKGRVPLKEAFFNEFLATALAKRETPLRELQLSLHEKNRFTVFARTRYPLLPVIRLDFEIVPDVDFRQDGTLELRSLGFLGGPVANVLRTVLLRLLRVEDSCVTVERNRIRLHLRDMLESKGLTEYAAFVRTLHFTTQAAKLNFEFHIRVDIIYGRTYPQTSGK